MVSTVRPVANMVYWADTIDGASYPSAKDAVEMKEPAMKLTMTIEATQDPGFVPKLIPLPVIEAIGRSYS